MGTSPEHLRVGVEDAPWDGGDSFPRRPVRPILAVVPTVTEGIRTKGLVGECILATRGLEGRAVVVAAREDHDVAGGTLADKKMIGRLRERVMSVSDTGFERIRRLTPVVLAGFPLTGTLERTSSRIPSATLSSVADHLH